jgi:hypothetical protein
LKKLAPFVAPKLTVIFKISYESGTIPAILKTANICPVFKKGETIEAINYRRSFHGCRSDLIYVEGGYG